MPDFTSAWLKVSHRSFALTTKVYPLSLMETILIKSFKHVRVHTANLVLWKYVYQSRSCGMTRWFPSVSFWFTLSVQSNFITLFCRREKSIFLSHLNQTVINGPRIAEPQVCRIAFKGRIQVNKMTNTTRTTWKACVSTAKAMRRSTGVSKLKTKSVQCSVLYTHISSCMLELVRSTSGDLGQLHIG